MVGEVDAVAPCGAHAGEERRDVARERVLGERPVAERRDGRLDRAATVAAGACMRALGATCAPMTVRTSISSGKNALVERALEET